MDPPLDFIPAENWYCKFCIEKYEYLNNDLTNATPLIFPEDFREVYKPETRRRANQRNWTRVATREARTPYNPLDGLFERIEEYRELNTRSRADRLQARLGRIDEEKENEQSVHYHGGKKDKRIKYKTKDNDKFEEQERRLLVEQEALMNLHLENERRLATNNTSVIASRLNRSRSQDNRNYRFR